MIRRDVWGSLVKDFLNSELPEGVPREIKINLNIPIKRAIVIVGPRRAGKTYLMYQLMSELISAGVDKKRLLYVNFESDVLEECLLADLREMLNVFYEIHPENLKSKTYLFLDELQNVRGWEKFVRSALDNNIQIVISGSSAKLLSKEIATAMRGRSLTYYIYPFSFNEFLAYNKIKPQKFVSSAEKASIINLLAKYMNGSYPEAIIFEKEKNKILSEILEVTIYRDIVERHKIKNIRIVKILLKALISSQYFSVHKFYNYLKSEGYKISKNTLYNYLEYFSEALVIFALRRYSTSYKEQEQTTPKIYTIDPGLLTLNNISDKGRIMENVIFIELLRRGYTPNKDLFYAMLNNSEIDFVIAEGKKVKELIQVCYELSDFNVINREVKPLINGSRKFKCNNLKIITFNQEMKKIIDNKKIDITPLWKWLSAK